jgi:hypothetical protein
MEWQQVITIIAANFAMILWCMRERRADFLYITKLIEEMKSEMKDFHGRMCAIEERNKNR